MNGIRFLFYLPSPTFANMIIAIESFQLPAQYTICFKFKSLQCIVFAKVELGLPAILILFSRFVLYWIIRISFHPAYPVIDRYGGTIANFLFPRLLVMKNRVLRGWFSSVI